MQNAKCKMEEINEVHFRFIIFHFALCIFHFALYSFCYALMAISILHGSPALTQPVGLPPVPWPEDNSYSPEKAELGRLLYFDTRLSADNTVSCASCHNAPCGFSDGKPIAVGIAHRKGSRHSPTIINTAYLKYLFWDGRANSLEEQCMGPTANTNEMAKDSDPHAAHQSCERHIQHIIGYKLLFKKIFGDEKISMENIAKAIATFERTILSGNSPYDRYQNGDKTAMTPDQIKGWEVFKKSNCIDCHGGFNFSDSRFTNIGIGMDKPNPDTGRYDVTHQDKDWGAFKIPTLRETALTTPFMHDGSIKTLEEVVDYYDKGGTPNKNLHPLMRPLNLSVEDKMALVSFLKALSGEGWQHFQAPDKLPE